MYYLLKKNPFPEPEPYRTRTAGWNVDMNDDCFTDGVYLQQSFDKAFEFELWEYEEGGNGLAEFYYEAFPLMSDALIAELKKAGATNLQTYPAILKMPEVGLVVSDYKVVNVVGKLAAADMNKSEYIDMGGMGIIAVGFKNLVIDKNKTHNALLFRLAESLTDIVIHESVKEHLETCGFKYLRYIPCE